MAIISIFLATLLSTLINSQTPQNEAPIVNAPQQITTQTSTTTQQQIPPQLPQQRHTPPIPQQNIFPNNYQQSNTIINTPHNGVGLGQIPQTTNLRPYINPFTRLAVGTYQWISSSGHIFTMYICSGLPGDRYLYTSIQRPNINAFGAPDNTVTFAYIIARGILTNNNDGINVMFRGFRLLDSFGVDNNFDMTLIYSRCTNVWQLQLFDETYTLIKISDRNAEQTQCYRPSYQHTFSNIPNNIASFQSTGLLPWAFGGAFGGAFNYLNGLNAIYTLRSTFLNNGGYNIFGCGGYQNPITSLLLPGRRQFLGQLGPYGGLHWENALMVNAFNDLFPNENFDFTCNRGVEFQFFTDLGNLYCSSRCANQPTVGWAGLLRPINPLLGFGIQQCPQPNLSILDTSKYPGWNAINVAGFGFGTGRA